MKHLNKFQYLYVILFTIIFLFFALNLIEFPFAYSLGSDGGDGVMHQTIIKIMMEDGWVNKSSYLSQPNGLLLYDFPVFHYGTFHYVVMKFISFFTSNHFTVINIYFLLGFILATLTSFFVFKQFKINSFLAYLFALIYGFAPAHFYRGISHLFIGTHYLVPLMCLVVLWLLQGKISFSCPKYKIKGNKEFWLSILFCILMAIHNGYYTCFSLIILFSTTIIVFFTTKEKDKQKIYLRLQILYVLIATILLTFSILNIPVRINNIKNGQVGFTKRSPVETEIYGLRLAHLLSPPETTILKPVNDLSIDLKKSTSVIQSESSMASIGITASLGCVILFILLFGLQKKEFLEFLNIKRTEQKNILQGLSYLNIMIILYAIAGGFASLISYFITPQIRSTNRISIFISFFSIFTLAYLINNIHKKKLKIILISVFLGTAIIDLTSFNMFNFKENKNNYEKIINQNLHIKTFVERIENIVPVNSRILYIPMFCFPDIMPAIEGRIDKMGRYVDLTPYLYSKTLKWSSMSMGLRENCIWLTDLNKNILQNPQAVVNDIYNKGFRGIYLDLKKETEKTKKIYITLKNILHSEPLLNQDSTIAFFPLKKEDIDKINND